MSDDGDPIVVLSIKVGNTREVVGVFGPYENEFEAGRHVGILMDPGMLTRMSRVQISTSQFPLEDPSAFTERVEELLGE